jgi:hypothetical protein
MAIHRYRSTWRSLTFNPHYDNTGLVDDPAHVSPLYGSAQGQTGYFSMDQSDVNRVSVQDYRELRQFLEGGEPNEAFEGVRAINWSGRIFATSYGDLEDKAWLLNEQFSVAACRIAAQALTPKGVLPFSFRRDHLAGGVLTPLPLRFYARPGPGRPVWIGRRQSGLVRPYSVQLIAFDPFAYDEAVVNTSPALAGGNVSNPGNIYTRPIIVITMSGAGNAAFTLTNSTTGKSLVLDLTGLAAAQTITIDTARSTIVRDNGTDQYSRRVSGFISDFWLQPGVNAIAFANTGGITSVQFQVRGAYA